VPAPPMLVRVLGFTELVRHLDVHAFRHLGLLPGCQAGRREVLAT
jgi:hypothetical protein